MNISRRVVIGAVVAVVVVGAGTAAVLATRSDEPRRVHVATSTSTSGTATSSSSSTASSTSVSTSVSTSPSTSGSVPDTTPPTDAPTTPTVPGTTSDTSVLAGSITVNNPVFVAEQTAAFTLTISNTSDQTFHDDIKPPVHLSVMLNGTMPFPNAVCSDAETADFTIGPHEQRTYSMHITPTRHMLGPAALGAVLLYEGDTEHSGGTGGCIGGDAPGHVPAVAVRVVPPGWIDGQPLDAAQGHWLGRIKLAVQEAHVGDTVTVTATAKNTGTREQRTDGFGSLVADCHGSGPGPGLDTMWWRGAYFPATVIRPLQTKTMSFAVALEPGFVGTAVCTVEMAFHGDLEHPEYNRYLDASWNSFEVLAAG